MFKEFKDFAMRGNVIDMAVGIVIGAAFGTIVKSFVADVLMPPIGLMLGKVDFSNMFHVLSLPEGVESAAYKTIDEAHKAGAVTLNYGLFINNVINFLIVAFAIFMVVRTMNKLQKEEAPKAPTEHDCPACCKKVSLKATRCPHCTSEVKPA